VPARPRRRSSGYPVSLSLRCASTASGPDPTRPTGWTIGVSEERDAALGRAGRSASP
jgi:hypothetical protein